MDRVEATNELGFRVGFSGHSGHLRVEPVYTVEDRTDPIKSLPDFVLPPAFPRETPESIKEHIEDKYLSMGLDADEFSPQKVGRQWDFDWFDRAKIPLEPSLPRSVVVPVWEVPFRRQKKQGKWEPSSMQMDVSELMLGAQDSGTLPRMAGPAKDLVRGSINNRPFRPGGLDDSQSLARVLPDGASSGEWVREMLNGGPVQVVPPSFKQGLDLGELKAYPCSWNIYKDQDQSSLNSTSDEKLNELSVQFDDLFKKAWEEDVAESEKDGPRSESESVESDTEGKRLSSVKEADLSVLDEILSVESGGSTSILDGGGGQQHKEGPSWMFKAWETSEDGILAVGGIDGLVLIRIVVFSIRIFSIAAVICMFLVLPVNYYGKDMIHRDISSEPLEVFSISNVKEGSEWLWTHCFALYVITCSACVLLYFEHKSISRTRMAHITGSPPNPSHFAVLVRAVPWSSEQSYSDSVKEFFMKYYASSYLSHQIVHRYSKVQKLMKNAEKICQVFQSVSAEQKSKPCLLPCFCGNPNSSEILSDEADNVRGHIGFDVLNLVTEKKYAVAFVFFKTRYAAMVAAEVLHSENPMLWVTEVAPEPNDVLWSNLYIPYRQLWIRKIATLVASVAFMFVFLIPVVFVQGLTQLEQLSHAFPFLKGMFKMKFIDRVVTGYLPSVILILFLYTVPPTMMLFSTIEGSVSHSGRKKSACIKVLYFTIWNVFFGNVFSGSVISQLTRLSSVKDIPKHLAEAVPIQAGFFMTYVLTSGWASLSVEVVQPLYLLHNILKRFICGMKKDPPNGTLSFPYHTEVPRLLLFGFLGFVCAVMAPLILPFLLIYFLLAYLVYKNQIINVYKKNYESGGQYWLIAHKTIMASLVLSQIIALGVFGIKHSPVASGFTIPLIVGTLLFNEFCSQRFFPSFQKISAQVLMQMDQQDERSGRMEEIYQQLHSGYCQFQLVSLDMCTTGHSDHHGDQDGNQDPEEAMTEIETASRGSSAK